jgi:hypothetical protein
MNAKKSIEIRAVAFSDHFAVILHTGCMTTSTTRGRGLWKMNTSLLKEGISVTNSRKNGTGGNQRSKNTNPVCSGGSGVSKTIRAFFRRMG